ncbi:MAG: hypothetical protein AB1649_01375 [Chloroflexota bacterium]
MSGIGHLAAGLAAKPAAPEVPLWALLAAGEINDILYFFFSATGIEPRATFTMSFEQGVRYVTPISTPWSHGLFMSVVWSAAVAGIAFLFYRNKRIAGSFGLVAFSHWILDFLMHSNLPLFFGSSDLLGLGLENSGPGFIFVTILDLVLVGAGLALYLGSRNRKITAQESRKTL